MLLFLLANDISQRSHRMAFHSKLGNAGWGGGGGSVIVLRVC